MAGMADTLWSGISTFLIFLLISLPAHAFNIDTATRLIHRYDRNTKFGYAVDLYSDRSAHWVLVGAPQAQTRQPGVRNGGAVFKCSTVGQACYEIKFDERGHNTALNGSILLPIDSKTDQWFGATVVASRKSNVVVACAPRYTYFYATFDKKEPVGTCFVAGDTLSPDTVREYSPCRGTRWGYHRLGYCMAGFSAAISENGENLFMGAPGAYYWQGALVSQALDQTENGDPLLTREGPAQYDDQYLGYAMASGELDGNDGDDVAVGIPKGNGLLGQVSIFNARNQNLKNLSGEQVGSYFGAALAITDLNDDGYDDLIVGAPLFTQQLVIKGVGQAERDHEWPVQDTPTKTSTHGTKQTGGYEAGKVYIFWQREDNQFYQEDYTAISGKKDWARFGHAVAAVGDLNGDGFNDFVVGAPYDSEDGRGAVHVFNGNAEKKFEKPSQIIYGENVGDNVKTFGFSVAGGVDVDGNEYPDVVVGAYSSDRAVLMKTRPVVSISGSVALEPTVIDLEQSAEASSKVIVCMNYSGKGAPDTLNLRLEIDLDSAQSPENKRAHFFVSNNARYVVDRVELRKGQRICDNAHHIVVPDTIRDKLTPILVNVSYSVNEQQFGAGRLTPIKNALLPQSWASELHIANSCGPDQQCIPNLQLSAESSKPTISRGVSDRVNLSVVITNPEKDAHQAKFYVYAPRGVNWVGTFAEEFGHKVHCTPPNATVDTEVPSGARRGTSKPAKPENEVSRLECDIGNPFKNGQKLKMQVEYQTGMIPVEEEELVFKLEVNSTLPDNEATRNDNKAEVKVKLESKIKVKINTVAVPDQVTYSKDDDRTGDLDMTRVTNPLLVGPYVSHTYSVLNDASSATKISKAKLDIFFPHFTPTNDYLLYVLYDIIHVDGPIRCTPVQPQNINPLGWVVPRLSQRPLDVAGGPVIAPTRRPSGRRQNQRRRERQAPEAEEIDDEDEGVEQGIGAEDVKINDRSALSSAFLKFVKSVKEVSSDLAANWFGVKELTVDCGQMHCTQWTCNITDLAPGHAATVTINSTLFLKTLLKENVPKATISSLGVVEVTQLPYEVPKNHKNLVEAKTATTIVHRLTRDVVARGIPSWMIIVAILTGITLLILLILLFWRLGFFKRKRPPRGQAKLNPSEGPETRGQYSTYSPATQEYSTAYRPPPYGERL